MRKVIVQLSVLVISIAAVLWIVDSPQEIVAQSVPVAEIYELKRGTVFRTKAQIQGTYLWLSSGPKMNSDVMNARPIIDEYGSLGLPRSFHLPTLRKALRAGGKDR